MRADCLLASDLVEPPGVKSQTDKHRHHPPYSKDVMSFSPLELIVFSRASW